MRKTRFTKERVERLGLSSYVASVSNTTVRFTVEFKKRFLEERRSGREVGNHRKKTEGEVEPVEQRLSRLENELAYTRQEVEFLKETLNCSAFPILPFERLYNPSAQVEFFLPSLETG